MRITQNQRLSLSVSWHVLFLSLPQALLETSIQNQEALFTYSSTMPHERILVMTNNYFIVHENFNFAAIKVLNLTFYKSKYNLIKAFLKEPSKSPQRSVGLLLVVPLLLFSVCDVCFIQ
jgi:hypothetical protein